MFDVRQPHNDGDDPVIFFFYLLDACLFERRENHAVYRLLTLFSFYIVK
jgi:hypothetical protein